MGHIWVIGDGAFAKSTDHPKRPYTLNNRLPYSRCTYGGYHIPSSVVVPHSLPFLHSLLQGLGSRNK